VLKRGYGKGKKWAARWTRTTAQTQRLSPCQCPVGVPAKDGPSLARGSGDPRARETTKVISFLEERESSWETFLLTGSGRLLNRSKKQKTPARGEPKASLSLSVSAEYVVKAGHPRNERERIRGELSERFLSRKLQKGNSIESRTIAETEKPQKTFLELTGGSDATVESWQNT